MMMMNKYQTVFTEEDFKLLPKEVKADFYEFLETVPFIKWLIQPEELRGFAKNLTRWNNPNDLKNRKEDPNGKIYVDITKPHILENMNYFRERAIFYDKYHRYTDITPNPNPKSDYAKFWRKELKRWKEGMIRESDGEWIPGGLYFYWNYCPIWLVEEAKEGAVEGTRQRKFPKPWLGDYLFFHYMEQARNNGEHVKMLKTRGVGASFKMGSLSPRNMYIYPGSGNPNFHLASDKTFLTGDKGVFGKVVDTLDWIADNTPLPKLRLINGLKSMEIQLGYQDEYGVRKGLLSSVYGISLKDNPDKARGIRGPLIHYEEDGLFPHLESAWNINRKAVEDGKVAFGQMVALGTGGVEGCLTKNNLVHKYNGALVSPEKLTLGDSIIGFNIEKNIPCVETISYLKESIAPCIRITTNSNRVLECTLNHPILASNHRSKSSDCRVYEWIKAEDLKLKDVIVVANELPYFGEDTLYDARLVGMLIGDGSYGERQNVRYNSCDKELIDYVESKYPTTVQKEYLTKNNKIFKILHIKKHRDLLREIGIYGQTKTDKQLPKNYATLSKESIRLLIAGLFDTDGNISNSFSKKRNSWRSAITLTSASLQQLKQVRFLLQKLGIYCNIITVHPNYKSHTIIKNGRKPHTVYNNNVYYNINISNGDGIIKFAELIPSLVKYKYEGLQIAKNLYLGKNRWRRNEQYQQEVIKNIEFIGPQTIYNLTTSNTHTYIANGIITHNSDFAGAEKLFYNPTVYKIYGIPNVYDKNSSGKTLCGFFWGAYLNRKGCYDLDNGEPDVTKALMEIVINRVKTRASATDSKTITQNIAEEPITPQDAVMRIEGTVFPVADLKDYLGEISSNMLKFTSPHYVGNLIINSQGDVEFRSDSTVYPVRDFPALDNKKGAVEIFELPKKTKDSFRYISGIDPYDDDIVEYSDSLGSVFVFDRYTRRIVAEYTGRPGSANEFYEIVYRLARFYNATIMYENNKKGLYAYFNNVKGAITMLADTPEILTDKQLSKPKSISGNVSKGINATAAINSYGLRLQADWMLEAAYSEEVLEQDGEDSINKVIIPNFRKIRSVGYIKEAVAWNPKINADRVSAMNMVMIYDTELSQYETFGTKSMASKSIDPFYSKIYPIGKDSGTIIGKGNKLVFGYTPKQINF